MKNGSIQFFRWKKKGGQDPPDPPSKFANEIACGVFVLFNFQLPYNISNASGISSALVPNETNTVHRFDQELVFTPKFLFHDNRTSC